MSHNRLEHVLMFLHIVNKEDQPKPATNTAPGTHLKIRPPLKELELEENLKSVHDPEVELAVDELRMPWRGRLGFKRYVQSEQIQYGIKMYFC